MTDQQNTAAVSDEDSAPQFSLQRIQFTCALQSKQVIAPANMGFANPDLRDRRTTCLLSHLGPYLWLAVDLDFFEGNALFLQQSFGSHAVRAIIAGINDNLAHITSPAAGCRLFQRLLPLLHAGQGPA